MDNSRGIQAVTHCEITNMHNIEHKEDSKSVIFQLTYYSLNLFGNFETGVKKSLEN